MKTIVFGFFLLSSLPLFAQSFEQRMYKKYLETDKVFDIDCRYTYNKQFGLLIPTETTKKVGKTIQRNFTLDNGRETLPFKFTLFEEDKKTQYQIEIAGSVQSSGRVSKREFYIAPIKDLRIAKDFETLQIYCNVNFAYELPHPITDGNYHIAVHPHKRYDWQFRLKDKLDSYLNDSRFTSLVLLDTGNYRGNLVNISTFLNGEDYKLPQDEYPSDLENVSLDIPLLVSPAGHNRYTFLGQKEINVTYTGGNHNYCIWNNTRRLLESVMRTTTLAKVNIYYDTSATVAQQRGIEGLKLSFSRQSISKSNLLKDLLQDSKAAQGYHASYHNYFKTFFFREFLGNFKTVKLRYEAQGFIKNDIVEGNGTRDLEINLIYINQ